MAEPINIQMIVRQLQSLVKVTYGSGEVLCAYAQKAIELALQVAPAMKTPMERTATALALHSARIQDFKKTGGPDWRKQIYPEAADLKKWVIQAMIDYNAATEGADAASRVDFMSEVSNVVQNYAQQAGAAAHVVAETAKSAWSGMKKVVVGVGILGGLFVLSEIVKNVKGGRR